MKISKPEARKFLLNYHFIHGAALSGKAGILQYFDRVHTIQYDPLNPVGTNPELVLQARVGNFTPELLHQLLYSDRLLIDGWDKNMGIYQTVDWPYFARYRQHAEQHYGEKVDHVLPHVLQLFRELGPLDAKQIDLNERVIGDWGNSMKVSSLALEHLYRSGKVVIYTRKGTHRTYDLIENHLAPELLTQSEPFLDDNDFYRWQLQRRVESVGLMASGNNDALLGIRGLKAAQRNQGYQELLEQEIIGELQIADLPQTYYYPKVFKKLFKDAVLDQSMVWLGPLDNMIWDRQLIEDVFGFYYRWEVYKPAAQRQYGYYVLPVLYQDRFVARMEAKYDRKDRVLRIIDWWFEPGVNIGDKKMMQAFEQCLHQFVQYLGAEEVDIATPIF
ncbi:winged helix-turn-helix domain-containing protein [Culicoidibacter larvae]|uniref:winged helix-turn-helix domain-containing protein n=1 Tax=Culicoidibacter larvae TaxID=2579976 RepID=UPI00148522E7|nr:crosslink repair DNA glycosylase YcaQ family protein [Culicoidibacter larvae]